MERKGYNARSQILELLADVVNLDLATGSDGKGLLSILSVTDVRSEDADALEHGVEDGSLEGSGSGETDCHQSSSVAEVVDSLGVSGTLYWG